MGQDVLIGGGGLGVQRLALGEDEFVGLFQRSQHGGVEVFHFQLPQFADARPVPLFAGHVAQQSPLPIFADESIQRLKDVAGLKGAFTGINIKLMKCTGMREAWKMVTLARALDMKVMVGCMTETSCAITAASQFSPAVDFADLDGSLLIANDRFKGMEVVKGKITLPDLPGIGVVKL